MEVGFPVMFPLGYQRVQLQQRKGFSLPMRNNKKRHCREENINLPCRVVPRFKRLPGIPPDWVSLAALVPGNGTQH